MLDGLFQQAPLHQLAGNEKAADDLAADVVRVLDTLKIARPWPARPAFPIGAAGSYF